MHCRRTSTLNTVQRQRGAALIVAMLVFALAASLVVAMKSEFNRFFERTANILLAEQAQAYLRGAEELAAMALIRDYDKDNAEGQVSRDDLSEDWARPSPPFALDGTGWMKGELRDLQGRFNLNALVESGVPKGKGGTVGRRFTPPQEQFIRLLQALGDAAVSEQEAKAITESISDWLDADSEPLQDGAEENFYYGLTPAYRAANRSMTSVSELRAVANVTPEIYQALLPWVTVLPDAATTLNIHTAEPTLLRSINADGDLTPLSEADGESLGEALFEDKNAFFASPVFAGKQDKMDKIKKRLGVESNYFLLEAQVEVAGREMRLYSVLHRQDRTIKAIARGPIDEFGLWQLDGPG